MRNIVVGACVAALLAFAGDGLKAVPLRLASSAADPPMLTLNGSGD